MAYSLIFPQGYNDSVTSSSAGSTMPMIGIQAVAVGKGSSAADLKTTGTGNWVWLPIPVEGVSTEHAQNWGEESASAMKSGISAMIGGLSSGDNGINWGAGAKAAGNLMNYGDVKGTISEFIGEKFGVAGITGRLLQQSIMAYQGPSYRSFKFSWDLKPTSRKESSIVESIVTHFQRHSMPRLQNKNGLARHYKVPHLFEITFAPRDGLPKLKVCNLQNVEVKWGGEKYNVFTESNHPTAVTLGLSFTEMELLHIEDFPSTTGFAADAGDMSGAGLGSAGRRAGLR